MKMSKSLLDEEKLVAEFYDIFDPLGMPVDRDTVHHIELLPNAEPHYRC